MSVQEHVDSLLAKHASLEDQISEELHRPLPDQPKLSHLKKQKLRLKDEIDRLQHDEDPDEVRPEQLN